MWFQERAGGSGRWPQAKRGGTTTEEDTEGTKEAIVDAVSEAGAEAEKEKGCFIACDDDDDNDGEWEGQQDKEE